jgi:biotin-dependent carboxylase-like uncharacterized protein
VITVLAQGGSATVQDLGRQGALRWGVGTAGAMDSLALAGGNLLVGNDEDAAAIEIQVFPYEIRFERDCVFALTGADCGACLDGVPLLPWASAAATSGAVLRFELPRPSLAPAARAYLCVAGGIDVPLVLGSRSTQLRGAFGGFEGRALKQGDCLPIGAAQERAVAPIGTGLVPPALAMPLAVDELPAIRVLPAAEYGRFTEASQKAFWDEPWKVTPQSDRYGFRLAGPNLAPKAAMEMRSHGIVPGVIQVPPGGQPIVQMRDAQPSGGYPKIGTVIEADLWRLGQAPIGSRLRFVETDWDGALAADQDCRTWLATVRRQFRLSAASRVKR